MTNIRWCATAVAAITRSASWWGVALLTGECPEIGSPIPNDVGHRKNQGDSVCHHAQEGQEALGIPGKSSSCGGEILVVVQSTDRDGRVPYGGQLLRAVAGADPACILMKGDVTDVVQLVFDLPVGPHMRGDLLRIGLVA